MDNRLLAILLAALLLLAIGGAYFLLQSGTAPVQPLSEKELKQKFDLAVEKAAQMKGKNCEISEAERLLRETRNAFVQGDLSSATAILMQAEEAIRNANCPGVPPVQPPANQTNQTWNGSIKTNSNSIAKYSKFEISLKSPKQYSNPFDSEIVTAEAHFTSPSGKEETAIGFWYQDYSKEEKLEQTRRGDAVRRQVYTLLGEPVWMFRYAPVETGEYNYYITINEGGSASTYRHPQSGSLKFSATSSNSKGYIEVSKKDFSYFSYSNGETFLPVGHGPEMDSEKLQSMAEHKMNIVQAEFTSGFKDGLAGEKLGQYGLENAFVFDGLLEQAEDSGIYAQMVLVGWPEFADNKEAMEGNAQWDANPYNKKNGGMLDYPTQFFSNEQAKKYFKGRVRYMAARWGYSEAVFCWQLWGEFDMLSFASTEQAKEYYFEEDILAWHNEMGEYLQSIDKRHMVSTAEANGPYEALWQLPSMDYMTIHDYNHPIDWNLLQKLQLYQELGIAKPILIQEYGPEPLLGNQNLNDEANRAAYHNPLWQTTLMKASGAPMKWTWYGDEREATMDMDEDYKILSEFFAGSDFANKGIEALAPIDLTPKQNIAPITTQKKDGSTRTLREGGTISPVKVYSIGNQNSAYAWVHDLRYNEYEVNSGYQATTMQNVKFKLSGMDSGAYSVEFWNTYTGEKTTSSANAVSGSLEISVPSFSKDIAVKAVKQS